jgi:hypothetical protein
MQGANTYRVARQEKLLFSWIKNRQGEVPVQIFWESLSETVVGCQDQSSIGRRFCRTLAVF